MMRRVYHKEQNHTSILRRFQREVGRPSEEYALMAEHIDELSYRQLGRLRDHVDRIDTDARAKHGLVHLDQPLDPYDLALGDFTARQRQRWAAGVLYELAQYPNKRSNFVFFAGKHYRQWLLPALYEYAVPLEGLGIGEQMAVLKRELERRRCRQCGCTDGDCSQCIERTGFPCSWVESDLCSACSEEPVPA